MPKKDLRAAAAAQVENMKNATAAQRLAAVSQHEKEPQEKEKNSAPFTVWTTPENVRRWKAYQKAKKGTIKTQAALFELAIAEYMQAHPVTDAEKAELLKEFEL